MDNTMDMDNEELSPIDKITVLPGATADLSAATYCILEEDHTLGNLLRWMIMKNPAVEFCGYSAPHPSEAKIHIRIQTYDGVSSLVVLHEALDNLEHMTLSIQSAYLASLSAQEYVVPPEVAYDFESVNNRLWEEREMRPGQEGSREVFETAQREKEETRMKEINSREQKVKVVIKPKK